MTQPSYAVEAIGLTKRFGDTVAVDRLDLKVRKGDIFGLVGPDGAGKTSTLRLLATILSPSSGKVKVDGFDTVRDPRPIKDRIGYMSERFNLYPDLSVIENLHFYADIYSVPKKLRDERTNGLLHFSRLGPFRETRAEFLSGGMQRKLALAAILIHEPEVLFLDEPTSGVDPVSRREFWQILMRLHGEGKTLIIATPYMDEAERVTTVGFMDRGRMFVSGPPTEMRRRLEGRMLEIRARPVRKALGLLRESSLVTTADMYGENIQAVVDNAEGDGPAVAEYLRASGVEVERVRQVIPSIENVFGWLIRERRAPTQAPTQSPAQPPTMSGSDPDGPHV